MLIDYPLPFDENCDVQDVDQFGFIDLTDALTNGVVAPNATIDELHFDGEVEDLSVVGRRVKNQFDALDNLQNIAPAATPTE